LKIFIIYVKILLIKRKENKMSISADYYVGYYDCKGKYNLLDGPTFINKLCNLAREFFNLISGVPATHIQNSKVTELRRSFGGPHGTEYEIIHNQDAPKKPLLLHHSLDIIFPPCRERLPKDLEWLEEQKKILDGGTSIFEPLNLAWQEKPSSRKALKDFLRPLMTLTSDSPIDPLTNSASIETILECLLCHSPLFAKAYELASKPSVSEVPGTSIDSRACYDNGSHLIMIAKEQTLYYKAESLVFETLNAMQRARMLKVHQLAAAGKLGREEFTVLIEYLESDTLIWSARITGMYEADKTYKDYSFSEQWIGINKKVIKGGSGLVSHADLYRKQWDDLYSAVYLKKHPEVGQGDGRKMQNPTTPVPPYMDSQNIPSSIAIKTPGTLVQDAQSSEEEGHGHFDAPAMPHKNDNQSANESDHENYLSCSDDYTIV
jgi:hypothetical protein